VDGRGRWMGEGAGREGEVASICSG